MARSGHSARRKFRIMHDIWRSGFTRRSAASWLDRAPSADEITWLPDVGSFRFLAEPFGIERSRTLTVFVQAFDYRVRRGRIRFYQYDARDRLIGQGLALAEPWHLSYPFLIEDEDELYMLPSASKSGSLSLYRCRRFPDEWEPAGLLSDLPVSNASVVRHEGVWWMFFTLPGPDERAMRELHVAHAPRLQGPWRRLSQAPALQGYDLARPGGAPLLRDGQIHLPVQDCRRTEGAAVNILRITDLSPRAMNFEPAGRMEPANLLPGFTDGLRTLSGCGAASFMDVKAIRRSPEEGRIRTRARFHRWLPEPVWDYSRADRRLRPAYLGG